VETKSFKTKTVPIVDMAVVTSLGEDLKSTWGRLIDGFDGIRTVRRFSVSGYGSKLAALIEDLKPVGCRSAVIELLDRVISQLQPVPPDTIVITASTKVGVDNLERSMRGEAADFKDILPAGIHERLSVTLGLSSTPMHLSSGCASGTIALAEGAAMILCGGAESILVCCIDLVTEFVFSGFSSLKILSPFPCTPFDMGRKGLTLGEGAAALLLMSQERMKSEGRQCLGSICGWGAANDAIHLTSPSPDGRGLVRAINRSLEKAGISNADIAAVNAHGTGTRQNDFMELSALKRIFVDKRVPVHSIKGAVGHAMGAAGGIEAVIGIMSLNEGITPPTLRFENPEVGAEEWVSSRPVNISGDYLLSTNSGFGGIHAAILLGR
jgi:3-oxoacyl-[acyl-carrier-protein] synthase II